MAELRRSPLDDRHRALGATLAPFGGWEMPIDYGSVVAEHRAVRERCGVFDLSHLGTLCVTGPGAEACVQRAFTNDVASLAEGRAQYTLCLDADAGIVDDLIVYRLGWGLFAVPNAGNTAAVTEAVRGCADEAGAEVADVKADMACLAVQGPESDSVLAAAGLDVSDLTFLDCRTLDPAALASVGEQAVHGEPDAGAPAPPTGAVVARTGYTGERGYELFVPNTLAATLWDRLLAVGATPVGLGARDTLRLEMGYPLHGQDISRETTPVEARLKWAVKPGTGFTGEAAYVAATERGPSRRLWGLRVTGRGIPRAGCALRVDDVEVGTTTSGTFGPTVGAGVGMGYVDAHIETGEELDIAVRRKSVRAEVVRPPFVDRDPKA